MITGVLGIQKPVVLAPMGFVAGGALAAAVSRAGGLGLIGGGYGDAEWMRREFQRAEGERIGVVMLAIALTGYGLARLSKLEQIWLGAASVLVISPSRTATLVGLAMAVPIALRQLAAWRTARAEAAAPG